MKSPTRLNSRSEGGVEILNTRVFDAPRERVFEAFARQEQLMRWWGPNGFTNTIDAFDLRPGGAWHIVMHGPDGTNYPNFSEFIEVVRPERIVFVHLRPMHRYHMTMTYDEASAEKTKLSWRMVLEQSEENEQLKDFITAANEQNFDRLAALLANIQH